MSFLFGKKKQAQNALPPATRESPTSGSSVPSVNGVKGNDRGPATTQTPTPGSSLNNSINSISGAHTANPEHGHAQDSRGAPEHVSRILKS